MRSRKWKVTSCCKSHGPGFPVQAAASLQVHSNSNAISTSLLLTTACAAVCMLAVRALARALVTRPLHLQLLAV